MSTSLDILKLHPKFVNDVPDDCKCVICKEILIDAHCGICGCQFCLACLDKHLENKKQYCPGGKKRCDSTILVMTNVQRSHVANCKIEALQIECVNEDCKFESPLEDMAEHIRSCEHRIVDCFYRDMGCVVGDISQIKLKSHLVEAAMEHSALLASWSAQIHNGVQQGQHESDNERQKMLEDIAALRVQMEANKTELQTQKNQFKEELQTQKNQFKEELQTVQKTIEQMQNEMKACSGQFDWVIEDLPQKRTEAQNGGATSIMSEAFFSGIGGYKLCLEAFPNGTETGTGSYFTVFFVLMKGFNVEVLKWPCNRKIIIQILNQETGSSYQSQTWDYTKVNSNTMADAIMGRPTSEKNSGYGTYNFVSWTNLNANSSVMKNGSVVLKCLVQ